MSDQTPTVRESIALVAQACRPGSLEARVVHSCTCEPIIDRQHKRHIVWTPDQVEAWQGSISLDCPAHGRLLERYLHRQRDNPVLKALVRSWKGPAVESRRASVLVRLGSAIRGWLRIW